MTHVWSVSFLEQAIIMCIFAFTYICQLCVWKANIVSPKSSYKWEAIDQDSQMKYTFKLCDDSPETKCGPGSSVCAHSNATNTDTTVGKFKAVTDIRVLC